MQFLPTEPISSWAHCTLPMPINWHCVLLIFCIWSSYFLQNPYIAHCTFPIGRVWWIIELVAAATNLYLEMHFSLQNPRPVRKRDSFKKKGHNGEEHGDDDNVDFVWIGTGWKGWRMDWKPLKRADPILSNASLHSCIGNWFILNFVIVSFGWPPQIGPLWPFLRPSLV